MPDPSPGGSRGNRPEQRLRFGISERSGYRGAVDEFGVSGGNMLSSVQSVTRSAQVILQTLSFGLVLISALVLCLLTLGAAAGLLPWLGLAVQIGDRLYENAGQIAQIGGPPIWPVRSSGRAHPRPLPPH